MSTAAACLSQPGWWALITSPGFVGIATLLAGFPSVAFAVWRWQQEQRSARGSELKDRWQRRLDWVWDNRDVLSDDAITDALVALENSTTDDDQVVFLEVTVSALLEGISHE